MTFQSKFQIFSERIEIFEQTLTYVYNQLRKVQHKKSSFSGLNRYLFQIWHLFFNLL